MWIQVTGIDLIEITLNLFWFLKNSTSLVSCRSMISGRLFLAMLLMPSCHMPVSHPILSFHNGDTEAQRGERTTVKWGGGGGRQESSLLRLFLWPRVACYQLEFWWWRGIGWWEEEECDGRREMWICCVPSRPQKGDAWVQYILAFSLTPLHQCLEVKWGPWGGGMGWIVCLQKILLTPSHSECDLIWKQDLYRGEQVKTKPLGWH